MNTDNNFAVVLLTLVLVIVIAGLLFTLGWNGGLVPLLLGLGAKVGTINAIEGILTILGLSTLFSAISGPKVPD